MIHTQDNIEYKIESNILKGWKGTSPFQKPTWNGSTIEEGWTQTDQDNLDEALELISVGELLDKFEFDGNAFYIEIRNLVKWHYGKGTINEAQFKAIRVTLEPALRPLKLGDWDIAQDNINAITRPNGPLGQLYDLVKNKIDNYLL